MFGTYMVFQPKKMKLTKVVVVLAKW